MTSFISPAASRAFVPAIAGYLPPLAGVVPGVAKKMSLGAALESSSRSCSSTASTRIWRTNTLPEQIRSSWLHDQRIVSKTSVRHAGSTNTMLRSYDFRLFGGDNSGLSSIINMSARMRSTTSATSFASCTPSARSFATSTSTSSSSERGIMPTKKKKPSELEIHQRSAPAPPREAAPFAEVGGANNAASSLVSLLVSRETTSHPLRLVSGLCVGYFFGFVAHSVLGIFDVLCLLSTTAGLLGYLFVVGSNFNPLFYFVSAPVVLLLGTPYWDRYFGLEPNVKAKASSSFCFTHLPSVAWSS
ncbi:unnamed protein product [Amoebophrya sp. A25]|nr:unnamed protein product [Amoebophrya sp. A25]|eukprot:GSA25T00024275001.1